MFRIVDPFKSIGFKASGADPNLYIYRTLMRVYEGNPWSNSTLTKCSPQGVE